MTILVLFFRVLHLNEPVVQFNRIGFMLVNNGKYLRLGKNPYYKKKPIFQ